MKSWRPSTPALTTPGGSSPSSPVPRRSNRASSPEVWPPWVLSAHLHQGQQLERVLCEVPVPSKELPSAVAPHCPLCARVDRAPSGRDLMTLLHCSWVCPRGHERLHKTTGFCSENVIAGTERGRQADLIYQGQELDILPLVQAHPAQSHGSCQKGGGPWARG